MGSWQSELQVQSSEGRTGVEILRVTYMWVTETMGVDKIAQESICPVRREGFPRKNLDGHQQLRDGWKK